LVGSKNRFKFAIPKLKNANSGFSVFGAIFEGILDRMFGAENFQLQKIGFSRT